MTGGDIAFMKERLESLQNHYADMVVWRRQLHERPELSFHEYETSAFIISLLKEWGIEIVRNSPNTAVIGRICGGRPGPVVALRADIDALPIQDRKECEYASKVPGVMHACGHDAHTAALLGLAKWFSVCREDWPGEIMLIFQHAEELCPGGAVDIIESGVLNKADAIYGVHLWTPLPTGHVYCSPGPMMASADEFEIEIIGKGGHGGLPHTAVDSVLVGSHLVVNLQSIVSRSINPAEPCVVSVGVMQAGSAFNVIAERCLLKGTVRTFNTQIKDTVCSRLEQIVQDTAAMFGAEAKIHYRLGYPPVVNHDREANRFVRTAITAFQSEYVHPSPLIMAAEDFAYYLQRLPGCFMLVGAGNPHKGIIHPHHHPRFDIDEEAMLHAAKLLAAMAMDFLHDSA